MTIPPKHFVGLHAHSNMSIGDALSLPQEHINFALTNGMDALALTDHGNMNGVSHQQLKAKELAKKGVAFKAIPGIEAYFVDSLAEWRKLHAASKRKDAPPVSEEDDEGETKLEDVGNELASTERMLDEAEAAGSLVEDESESKARFQDPLKQRNHLVLLPKSDKGVKILFRLTSESFIDGFYKYPRLDFDTLRKHAQGEIIGLSACLAGRLSKDVLDSLDDVHTVSDQNFELIQAKLAATLARFQEALGEENFFAELQLNRLGAQHNINRHLIELARRTGVKLVATADSHYADPNHWRQREIYKAMAWASKTRGTVDPDTIPKVIDELKCELYPKNAEQMWAAYQSYRGEHAFYDDDVVKEAIERSHDIAHHLIGRVGVDTSIKLPSLEKIVATQPPPDVDENDAAFDELRRLAVAGLKRRLATNAKVAANISTDTYIDRLKLELDTVKGLKFSKYFLTYAKIMEIVKDHMIIGNARGCFLPDTCVTKPRGEKPIQDVTAGECVIDAFGDKREVLGTHTYEIENEEIVVLEFDNGAVVRCTPDHKFLTTNRGWVEAQELTDDDDVAEV